MSMLETAEVVAERYNISRERQDEYSLECQRRTAAALQGDRFNDEIVPFKTKMRLWTRTPTGLVQGRHADQGRGAAAGNDPRGPFRIKPVFEGKKISAGNAQPAFRRCVSLRPHER